MNQTFSMNNLEAVFTFPFKDRQWIQKLGLACLLMTVGSFILPIIPTLFVVGYVARIQRRIIKDKSVPFLPAWDDWGQYLSDGFKLTVAGLIFIFPGMVFIFVSLAIYLFFGLWPAILDATDQPIPERYYILLPLGILVATGVMLVGLALLTVIGFISPAAQQHVLVTERLSAVYRVREWWPIFRANLAGYLITYLLILALSMVFSLVSQFLYLTIILCFLIPFIWGFVFTYILLVGGVLYAMDYRDGQQKLSLPATGALPERAVPVS